MHSFKERSTPYAPQQLCIAAALSTLTPRPQLDSGATPEPPGTSGYAARYAVSGGRVVRRIRKFTHNSRWRYLSHCLIHSTTTSHLDFHKSHQSISFSLISSVALFQGIPPADKSIQRRDGKNIARSLRKRSIFYRRQLSTTPWTQAFQPPLFLFGERGSGGYQYPSRRAVDLASIRTSSIQLAGGSILETPR